MSLRRKETKEHLIVDAQSGALEAVKYEEVAILPSFLDARPATRRDWDLSAALPR